MKKSSLIVWCVALVCIGMAAVNYAYGKCGNGTAAETAKQKRCAAIQAAKGKCEAAKEKRKANKEALEKAGENRCDKRQDNQAKRIQHGINKGYLTADEIAKLNAQQTAITDLETSIKSDGKITRAEAKQIQAALNEASRCIWTEKHDTEGNQMSVYRLGENVVAKDDLTSKLSDPNLSATEAKAIMHDFRRMMDLKTKLSGDLSDAERSKLQAEYDALLNQYFEQR